MNRRRQRKRNRDTVGTLLLALLWSSATTAMPGGHDPDPNGVLMRASDVLAAPGATLTLAATLVEPGVTGTGESERPLVGTMVEFLLASLDGEPLAEPARLGVATSDRLGRATFSWRPELATPKGATRHYGVVARPDPGSGRLGLAVIDVFVAPRDRPILAIQLDAEPVTPGDVLPVEQGAVSGEDVLFDLAETFQPVYLSSVAAPRGPAFKAWVHRRLPAGPVILVGPERVGLESEPRNDEPVTTSAIRSLTEDGLRVTLGLGSNAGDARAFAAAGLPSIVVPRDPGSVGPLPEDSRVASSWTTVLAQARLCAESRELVSRVARGGDDGSQAERSLLALGRAGVRCVDPLRNDPALRAIALLVGDRLRALEVSG